MNFKRGMNQDMNAMRVDEVSEVVRSLVREQFGEVPVERIEVVEDRDFDGDPVYRVLVVVDRPDQLDARKMGGFVRHIRSRIEPDETFPLVSFRSSGDDRRVRAEAA